MIVSKDQFRVLKERWQQVVDNNYKGIDHRIVSSLCMLNEIPGIATVWCCSGHTHDETSVSGKGHYSMQRRYISFVFENYDTQVKVCEVINQWRLGRSLEDWRLVNDSFMSYSKIWCFKKLPAEERRSSRYSLWNLGLTYNRDFLASVAIMEREWSKLITSLSKELGQ